MVKKIPSLGIGTWQATGDDCVRAVLSALEIGYRHIDTADRYGNHREVAKGIKESGLKREEIFLTTKKWMDDLSKSAVIQDVKRFQDELQTDYFDLVLIHWPNRDFDIKEAMVGFEELKEEGIVRSVGVSNFTQHHIEDVLGAGFEIVNNQVELHPSFNQNDLKKYCDSKKISLTAYSPLGRGEDLSIKEVQEIAKKHGATPAQIIIAWIIERGIVAIPKSTNTERVKENFEALKVKLDGEDMEKMNSIAQKPRMLSPGFQDFDY